MPDQTAGRSCTPMEGAMPATIDFELAERRRQSAEAYRIAGLPPIGGGQQTEEELAAEAEAKRIADEEAARLAEEEKNLNDAGKLALQKERDARKAAAKRADEAETRAAELEAKQAEADAAKAQAEEAEAKRKGEFEQLANKRAEELQTATGERDTFKSQLDALIEAIKPEVDEQWAALPAEVTELYEGDATDVLAKRAHIAKCRKLIDKLAGTQEQKKASAGFARTPNPNTNGRSEAEETALKANSRRYQ